MRRIALVLTVATLMAAMVMTTALAASQAGNDNGGGAGPARDHKVTICHKDHVTITVDEHAWPAHQRHGDTLGACSTEEAQQEASEEKPLEERTTTVTGEVSTTTDAEGDTEYTLRTAEGQVFVLSAGPPWFYGEEDYPLKPFVGETVTVTGEIEANHNKVTICHKNRVTITVDEHAWPAHRDRHNDTLGACSTEEAQQEASEENRPEIEVFSASSDGRTTKIRSPGKPPWAGGPKVVGKKHPGFAGCCKDNE